MNDPEHRETVNRAGPSETWDITVLLENNAASEDLAYEHGLSIWIETPDGAVLFDTGHSDAFVQNAERLGVRVERAAALVISHGHYDHAGGLAAALLRTDAPLYVGPGIADPRATTTNGVRRDIGLDPSVLESARGRVRLVAERTRILDAVEVFPAAPRLGPIPSDNARLMRRTDAGYEPDPFHDELSIVIHAPDGRVLVTGCSHRGIVNIVRQADPVRVVVGGLHLAHEPEEQVAAVAHELAELGVEELWVGHCTGDGSAAVLSREFAGPVVGIAGGMRRDLWHRQRS